VKRDLSNTIISRGINSKTSIQSMRWSKSCKNTSQENIEKKLINRGH